MTTCRFLAPEDVSVGDYVTQMTSVCEMPSFLWACDPALSRPEQPVRNTQTPRQSGVPACVRSICLPFLFIELATGQVETWDLRQCQVARMSTEHAQLVWNEMNPLSRRRRKKEEASREAPGALTGRVRWCGRQSCCAADGRWLLVKSSQRPSAQGDREVLRRWRAAVGEACRSIEFSGAGAMCRGLRC